jgi:SAM-dependent methyltransferase
MSPTTLKHVDWFKRRYPIQRSATILEVGSADVNGSVQKQFSHYGTYTGCDIAPGPNVDIVTNPSIPLQDQIENRFDLILCFDVLEHTLRPWDLVCEMASLLNQGGKLFIIAPFAWPEHRHPIDCYRFAPDGLRHLAERAGLEVLDCWLYKDGAWPKITDWLGWLHFVHGKMLMIKEPIKTGFAQTCLVAEKGSK